MPTQPPAQPHENETSAPVLEAMIANIGRRIVGNTDRPTPISCLTFFRREKPMPPCICLVEPSIVLVVQGEKQMLVGGEAYPYDINRFLITSLDLPANSQIVTASADKPCLGLVLKLDIRIMAELIAQGSLPLPTEHSDNRGVGIGLGTVSRCCWKPSNACWTYSMILAQSPCWRR